MSSHLGAIWRRRWFVLAVTVLVAVVFYAGTYLLPETFSATTQLAVQIPATQSSGAATQDAVLFYSQTFAALGRTTPVLDRAARDSGLGIGEAAAEAHTSVTGSTTVGLIYVTAKEGSPAAATKLSTALAAAITDAAAAQEAAALAQQVAPLQAQSKALASQLAGQPGGTATAASLQAQLQTITLQIAQAQLAPRPQVAVASPPDAGTRPTSPKRRTYALLGAVTALILAAEGAAGLDYLSDRFDENDIDDDVERILAAPVLAAVPGTQGPPLVEAIRTLRTNLVFMHTQRPLRTIAVVGHERGLGRTTIASTLATVSAGLGISCVLVDADLRHPVLAERMGVPPEPGLGDVLMGKPLASCTSGVADYPTLSVLPAGRSLDDPGGYIGEHLAKGVFQDIPDDVEFVVLDTAAESQSSDALAVAAQSDATIVVIDPALSRRRSTLTMVDQLRRVEATVVGVVVNRTDDGKDRSGPPRRAAAGRTAARASDDPPGDDPPGEEHPSSEEEGEAPAEPLRPARR